MNVPSDEKAALLARETCLADLGELAGPLTHEFNNLLNNLTLHLEILKHKAPETLNDDVERIQRQIGVTASQIAQFQRYRRAASAGEEWSDVNRLLRQCAELLSQAPPPQANGLPLVVPLDAPLTSPQAGVASLSLALQESLPPVRGYAADLRRLCRFLLHNAVRAAAVRGGTVVARTLRQHGPVQLVIEDDGPEVPETALMHVFEPGQDCREGTCGLELAACRSIVRRLKGRIEARARPNGGLRLVVSFAE